MELRKMIRNPSETNGWVIRNLREFHNSLIPDCVVDLCNGRTDLIPVLIKYASDIDVKLVSDSDNDLLTAWEV